MEYYDMDQDIKTICVTAISFPDGVQAAFKKLQDIIPGSAGRRYFGISRPEVAGIMYKAAAEQLEDHEAEKLGLESFLIPKGSYIGVEIPDFMNHIPEIGKTFRQLLSTPNIDPNGFCLEMYIGENDVRCMVKLENVRKSEPV
jgi:hypothetical protein